MNDVKQVPEALLLRIGAQVRGSFLVAVLSRRRVKYVNFSSRSPQYCSTLGKLQTVRENPGTDGIAYRRYAPSTTCLPNMMIKCQLVYVARGDYFPRNLG